MHDVIIIGSGPAGISAAIHLRKINIEALVIGKDYGQLTKLDMIDNWYGQLPISGERLIEKGIEQAIHLGIPVKKETVLNVETLDDHFVVTTNQFVYQSKTLVLATGKPRVPLNIEGFMRLKSRGIHLCTTCDGLLYKRKPVSIIGSGPYMEQELKVLENFTKDITIFTNGKNYTHPTYKVIQEEIVEFVGEKRLESIQTTQNNYPFRGVFLALDYPQATELSLKLGVLMESSNILVDENHQTNIKGLFAAGDVLGGTLQITKAVYDGLCVSEGIRKYLNKN